MARSQKPSDKGVLQLFELFVTNDRGFELEETPSWIQKREGQSRKLEKRNGRLSLALKASKAERALKPLFSAPYLERTTLSILSCGVRILPIGEII